MSSHLLWMIIGMGIVTYLPRVIPLTLFEKVTFPPFLQECLKNVPYAILGALIFPGVFFIQDEIWFGILGALIAFIIASFGVNVIVVVIGSILLLSLVSIFL